MTDTPKSAIFRPAHYSRFVIDPVTFINANRLSFNIGNVIKYVCRADAKGGLEDLEKAKRYIEIEIECLRRANRITQGQEPKEAWKDIL